MNRVSTIFIWIAVIIVSAFGLYRVKYEVQSIRTQIVETNKELAQENESLHVTEAEWSYLNRPERLQRLSEKYLASSVQLTVAQIAEVEAIPFPAQMQASADISSTEGDANITQIVYHKGASQP